MMASETAPSCVERHGWLVQPQASGEIGRFREDVLRMKTTRLVHLLRAHATVLLLIVAFAAIDYLIPLISWPLKRDAASAASVGAIFGFLLAQIYLLGFWAALGTGSPLVRLPAAILLALVGFGLFLVNEMAFGFVGSFVPATTVIAVPMLMILALPWTAGRFIRGWQFSRTPDRQPRRQYLHIKHLLISVTLVALILAWCRVVFLPEDAWRIASNTLVRLWIFLALVLLFIWPLLLPCVAFVFRQPDRPAAFTLAWAVVWALFLAIVSLLGSSLTFTYSSEAFLFWSALNWALFLTVGGVLLLLRRDGYRWTRKYGGNGNND